MGMTLVTGASGFVGSHLMAEMAKRGLPAQGLTRGMIPGFVTMPSFDSNIEWRECLAETDAIVHLAARVHVMHETATDPLALFREANVTATINLARLAAEAGIKRFIFLSSIKVNGERTEAGKPFTADDAPNPQDPYGISKAEAEAQLMELGRQTGLEITIVRSPLVYGPGVRGNFRSLMKWATSGVPSIFSAVGNKRSLLYVRNLCDLLITLLSHPNAVNHVYLASDGEDFSTHELLTELGLASGHRLKSIPVPPPILHGLGILTGHRKIIARLTENLQIDMTSTRSLLEWSPPVSLHEALKLHFNSR